MASAQAWAHHAYFYVARAAYSRGRVLTLPSDGYPWWQDHLPHRTRRSDDRGEEGTRRGGQLGASTSPRGPAPGPPLAGAPRGVWAPGPVTPLPGPAAGWRKGPADKIRVLVLPTSCALFLFHDVPSAFPSPGPSGPSLPFSSNLLQVPCQQLVSFIKKKNGRPSFAISVRLMCFPTQGCYRLGRSGWSRRKEFWVSGKERQSEFVVRGVYHYCA